MRAVLNDLVREEIQRFRLAFCCEDCRHFVSQDERCDLLYPTDPHRRGAFESAANGSQLVFCKMFEAE